MAGLGLTGIE
jgi:hypothetical protein